MAGIADLHSRVDRLDGPPVPVLGGRCPPAGQVGRRVRPDQERRVGKTPGDRESLFDERVPLARRICELQLDRKGEHHPTSQLGIGRRQPAQRVSQGGEQWRVRLALRTGLPHRPVDRADGDPATGRGSRSGGRGDQLDLSA